MIAFLSCSSSCSFIISSLLISNISFKSSWTSIAFWRLASSSFTNSSLITLAISDTSCLVNSSLGVSISSSSNNSISSITCSFICSFSSSSRGSIFSSIASTTTSSWSDSTSSVICGCSSCSKDTGNLARYKEAKHGATVWFLLIGGVGGAVCLYAFIQDRRSR